MTGLVMTMPEEKGGEARGQGGRQSGGSEHARHGGNRPGNYRGGGRDRHQRRGDVVTIGRIELLEKESKIRHDIDSFRLSRQNMITDIKQKRQMAGDLKEKRDSLNAEVKKLSDEAKVHIQKRNDLQQEVRKLKEKRSGITQEIKPKSDRIRNEKELRRKLNRTARTSSDDIAADFNGALKTLFEMELALRDEVIMVEMVMNIQQRFKARKNADEVNQDIHDTWLDIKSIEEEATSVTSEIMELASKSEDEHQLAMELYDRKNEQRKESQESHESYIDLVKEIKQMSKTIDELSQKIDVLYKKQRPLQNRLDSVRLNRREEQRLEQLKHAKGKLEGSGKIDLNDLRVLLESKALDLGTSSGKKKGKK